MFPFVNLEHPQTDGPEPTERLGDNTGSEQGDGTYLRIREEARGREILRETVESPFYLEAQGEMGVFFFFLCFREVLD